MNGCEYKAIRLNEDKHDWIITRCPKGGKTQYLKEHSGFGDEYVWTGKKTDAEIWDDSIVTTMIIDCLKNQSVTDTFFRMEYANAIYTGGGCYIFYGKLNTGDYFLADDFKDGICEILTTDPSKDWDKSTYEDWQIKHLVRELNDEEQRRFRKMLLVALEDNKEKEITNEEISLLRANWRE